MNDLPIVHARCHDSLCLERGECRRWLERETDSRHTRHLVTHRDGSSGPCQYRIALPLEAR